MTIVVPSCLGADHPVLGSVLPVIAGSRSVQTDLERLVDCAGWLAYEELPAPQYFLPFPVDVGRETLIDFILVAAAIDFAFTDFDTGVRFEVEYLGSVWSDSDALFACLHRALAEGVDVLDGAYLAAVDLQELERVFRAPMRLPMLDERVEILRAVGRTLVDRYDGRFHNVVAAASGRLYDDGRGLVEVLVREFPRFDDVVEHDGNTVRFYKLAQLAVWMLHTSLRTRGGLEIADLDRLSAFADYVVPAALHVLGILRYEEELERRIAGRRPVAAGSAWEVELRAHTIYATALLCDEVNARRPADLQVIVPRIDARLWVPFHRSHGPHHLTRTIMY